MEVFKYISEYKHEKIIFAQIQGVNIILGIHNTTLGPAVGGTRILDYENNEEALYDVVRLSYGMTLKNAAAGLDLGGGKAVLIGDAEKIKTEEFFKEYGEFLNSLNGIYYTAEDVNMTTKDIDMLSKYTKYVIGSSLVSSAPAPFTARGVYNGIKAAAKFKYGNNDLKNKVVAVQGLGNVGYKLCKLLYDDGVNLKVFDIDMKRMKSAQEEFKGEIIKEDEILTTKCDVLSPCALGGIINKDNVRKLNCDIIAGSANNVLDSNKTGEEVFQRGIAYVPDYIVNAGGVINCGMEIMEKYDEMKVNKKVDEIYNTVLDILKLSQEKKEPTNIIADSYALKIIENKLRERQS